MSEYQYTKNIRFKLVPTFQGEFQKEEDQQEKEEDQKEYSLKDLNECLSDFLKEFESFIYYSKEEKGQKVKYLRKKIKIHRNWLKRFCKLNFYEKTRNLKQNTAHFPIDKIGYLKIEIDKWIDENTESIKMISEIQEQMKHSQKRRSEAAFGLQKIISLKNFMTTFLKEVRTEDKDTHINELIKKWNKKIIKILEFVAKKYLPSQTAGLVIAKGSMNYYTVNKKPKDYQKKLEELKKELDNTSFTLESGKEHKKEVFKFKNHEKDIFTFKSEQEKKWLYLKCKLDFGKDIYSDQYKKIYVPLSITEAYELMKQFKSEQKAMFNEVITKIANHVKGDYEIKNEKLILSKDNFKISQSEFQGLKKLNELFQLFNFKTDKEYERYIRLTKEIQELSNKKNKNNKDSEKDLTQKITAKAKERGKFLFGKDAYFRKYADFCKDFKDIAMKKGKLIASVKGIEKEELEAKMTSHWSFIYQDSSRKEHYLWLIDKNLVDLTTVKKCIEKLPTHKSEGNLFEFHSFTKRALHKLCFAEESSFVEEMPPKLKNKQKDIKKFSVKSKDGIEKNLQIKKEEKELNFLKELLKSDYAKKSLNLKEYNLEKVQESKNLDEFEIELETACYKKKKYLLSQEKREELIKKFSIKEFLITSYDLKRKDKEIKKKSHTELWERFWQEDPSVRLNPEIVIRYREKDEEIQNYFKEKEFDKLPYYENETAHHRKLQEQYTGSFTLSLNAGKKHPKLAFCSPEELKKEIDNFNQNFNQKNYFKNCWKYGIDRGNIELATLCIAKFQEKEKYVYNGKEYLNPTFPKGEQEAKCYELKKEHFSDSKKLKETDKKKKIAIDNLSYFPVEEHKDWYEEKTVACMDLTTAKVIKDNIILNGDVKTYLKLKKESAKRRIYELYFKGQIQEDETLHFIKHAEGLIVPTSIKKYDDILKKEIEDTEKAKYQIYFFSDKYKEILSEENILKNLNCYLKELKEKRKELEELRKKGKLKEISQKEESKHTPTIDKINNLRKSLVANMVGVITHLQKTYPGIIVLEDLDKTTLEKHFTQHNENIGRILENSLYQKFQTLGKVPPHIKNIIELREERKEKKKTFQLGCIVFVDEKNTSSNCPHCEKSLDKERSKKDDEKFSQHRFLCGDKKPCLFDTYLFVPDEEKIDEEKIKESKNYEPIKKENKEKFCNEKIDFSEIDDPDKVAAYNTAKKIQEAKEIPPLYTEKKEKPSNKNNNKDSRNRHQNHYPKRDNNSEGDRVFFKHFNDKRKKK